MDSNPTNESDNLSVQTGERVEASAETPLGSLWSGGSTKSPLGIFWKWTGIKDKKLWDWIQLLGIPVTIAVLGNSFQTDQNLSKVRDEFLKDMSVNIYEKKIPIPDGGSRNTISDEITIATRTRILSTLQELGADGNRKGQILGYLYDTQILGGCRIGYDDRNDIIVDNCKKGYVPMQGADLSNLQISGSHLFNINLSGSNLVSADFRNAGLRGANFREANLTDADFRDAYLGERTQFACIKNYKFWLERVINWGSFNCKVILSLPGNLVGKSDFSKAIMYRANLEHAILDKTIFVEATLESANFKNAYMKNADLRKSYLQGADFSGAYLQGAYLQGANLQRANLQGANLQGAEYDSKTVLDFDPMNEGMLFKEEKKK
ncbi:MAG TPA: pentapeptide repeat-containing protein [Methylococcales bacterium]